MNITILEILESDAFNGYCPSKTVSHETRVALAKDLLNIIIFKLDEDKYVEGVVKEAIHCAETQEVL